MANPTILRAVRMNRQRSKRLVIGGAVAILIAVVPAVIKTLTELKFGNLASDPHWVRPVPTPFEQFMLGFPARTFFVALVTTGVVMLLAGLIGLRHRKSS
jgi:hypothetical protein